MMRCILLIFLNLLPEAAHTGLARPREARRQEPHLDRGRGRATTA